MTMGPSCMSSSAGLLQSLLQKMGMGASKGVQASLKRPRRPAPKTNQDGAAALQG